jgi:folate-binding protein YgfZ
MGPPTTVELDGQYRLLREEAGTVERPGRGAIVLVGDDAAEFLEGQLTNEIEALEPGQGRYAALLDRKGRMQSDLRALRLGPDRIWLDTEPIAAAAVARHLGLYRVGRAVELEDVGERHVLLSVIGPATETVLEAGSLAAEHANDEADVLGISCLRIRTTHGIDLICAAGDGETLGERLASAGAPRASEAAAEILRVEAGLPRFGAEMGAETIPQEAGINERAVSFTKGCYIGQETVARLHYKGKPNRHLRGLRLSDPGESGDPILLDDRELGRVGTAVISPRLGPIALAIVRREAQPGATVQVGDAGTTAEVVELPFE